MKMKHNLKNHFSSNTFQGNRQYIEFDFLLKLQIMRTYHCLPLFIWTYMFHAIDAIPFQEKTNSNLPNERIVSLTQDEGKILHRTKRGWMWNQFFLLEEYTGTDTQYVGKVRIFI